MVQDLPGSRRPDGTKSGWERPMSDDASGERERGREREKERKKERRRRQRTRLAVCLAKSLCLAGELTYARMLAS